MCNERASLQTLILDSYLQYMDKDEFDKYVLAGNIAAKVREESRSYVNVGASLLEIAGKIEDSIRKNGGMPAFPVNLSLNDEAAHYTPLPADGRKISEGDVIKVDIGVHVDGFIGDTAYTASFSEKHGAMVKAAEDALEKAVPLCIPGKAVDEISGVIEDTIKSHGFRPVANLTGHGLRQWEGHAEPTIHNVRVNYQYVLKEDDVIAVEPFATDGAGRIKDSEPSVIFSLVGKKPVRSREARKMLGDIEAFNGMPFTERW